VGLAKDHVISRMPGALRTDFTRSDAGHGRDASRGVGIAGLCKLVLDHGSEGGLVLFLESLVVGVEGRALSRTSRVAGLVSQVLEPMW